MKRRKIQGEKDEINTVTKAKSKDISERTVGKIACSLLYEVLIVKTNR